jgi:hypothetical protein
MTSSELNHHTTVDLDGGYSLHVWIDEDGDICLGERAGRALLSYPAHEWHTLTDAIEQTGVAWEVEESE